MKRLLLCAALLFLTNLSFSSSSSSFSDNTTTVTFDQVTSIGNPCPTYLAYSGGSPYVKNNTSVGFSLYLILESGAKKQYIIKNPDNLTFSSPMLSWVEQGINLQISNNVHYAKGMYIVPIFVDSTTYKIVSDLSQISSTKKADVWVAIFNHDKTFLGCDKVSGNATLLSPVSEQSIDSPPQEIYLQGLSRDLSSGTNSWICNAKLDARYDSWAVSSNKDAIVTMQQAVKNSVIPNMNEFTKIGSLVGDSAMNALKKIVQGINNTTTKFLDTTLASNWFLKTGLLSDVATLLSGETASGNLSGLSLNNANFIQSLSEDEQNYIKHHLVPALKALSDKISINVDDAASSVSVGFSGQASKVVVSKIYNNTKTTFTVGYLSSGGGITSIGKIKPGTNDVVLYGAANSQSGDILFFPLDSTGANVNSNLGTFRLSFLKGSQIIDLVKSGSSNSDFSYSLSAPKPHDEFICMQIKKGTFPQGDFPKTATLQMQSMISRTQCINIATLSDPVFVSLQIEDSMDVSLDGKVDVINQTKIPMFYPSMRDVTLQTGRQVPILSLPSFMQSQGVIVAWLDFLNIILGIEQSGYKKLDVPSILKSYKKTLKRKYVLRKKESKYGSITSEYIYAGLPGTEYLFTADMLSQGQASQLKAADASSAFKVPTSKDFTQFWISPVFKDNTYAECAVAGSAGVASSNKLAQKSNMAKLAKAIAQGPVDVTFNLIENKRKSGVYSDWEIIATQNGKQLFKQLSPGLIKNNKNDYVLHSNGISHVNVTIGNKTKTIVKGHVGDVAASSFKVTLVSMDND